MTRLARSRRELPALNWPIEVSYIPFFIAVDVVLAHVLFVHCLFVDDKMVLQLQLSILCSIYFVLLLLTLFLLICCLSTVCLLATKWFYNSSCLSCVACTVPVIGRTLTLPAISNAKLAKQVYVKLDPKCLGIEACLDIPLNIPVSPSDFLFFSFVSFILKLFGFHEKCESAPCKDPCRSRRQKRCPACRLTATCFRELC